MSWTMSETRIVAGGGNCRYEAQKKTAALEAFLAQVVDWGLAGVIFIVPFVMGGRQALGQFLLVALAVGIALAWTARQCLRAHGQWIHSAGELVLVAAILLVLLQLLPLPPNVHAWLSPHTSEVLPLWSSAPDTLGASGAWPFLTLTPAATRAGLTLLIAYSLLFLVTLQRIRDPGDAQRLLRWVALSAVAMAAFGLVQYLTSNGKFFWFYEHPFSDTHGRVKGSFTNRNHFAHFLALGVGPMIWWLQNALHGVRGRTPWGSHPASGAWELALWAKCLALGLLVFAALMSLSRGGVVALSVAATVCVTILYRSSLLSRKILLSLAGIALLVAAFLAAHGYSLVAHRIDRLITADMDILDSSRSRRDIWLAALSGIADFPIFGSGIGSHAEVYPMYFQGPRGKEYTHAENGYLQLGLEAGGAGLLLALAAIGLCGYWCITGLRRTRSGRITAAVAALAASLLASIAHSAVDFVWYVPGCAALVALLAGCACRLAQIASESHSTTAKIRLIGRPTWATALVCLACVGAWMIHSRLGPVGAERHWHRYLKMTTGGDRRSDDRSSGYAVARARVGELADVVRWDPNHARAHLRLASWHLKLFEHAQGTAANQMSLAQIREAAWASQFESRSSLNAWLERATGIHRASLQAALHHVRRALQLCPVQGTGYMVLAQVGFLKGMGPEEKSACVAQALRVRPLDGKLLFEAGKEAMLAGHIETALDRWGRSLRCGVVHQQRLIRLLAGTTPASFFLDNFTLDVTALRQLANHYRQFGPPGQLKIVLERCVQVSQAEARTLQGSAAAVAWLNTAGLHRKLENHELELHCLQQAVGCDRNSYNARYALGMCLFGRKRFAEAEGHLTWCQQRRPGDKLLHARVEAIVKERIRSPSTRISAGAQRRFQ